ncbi:biotin--[acetyl-CoA-carboxylase] ligase [Flavobacterium succinicans]|uniref:Bifunctional ligase/repressor BirA n=1 Tax=Flavobacterium succinicans TaxID=29536 RepID=A0A199XUQ8_9FLAO|nr:biotin--[acetyl-CoA-carboxylase] ligase [Flavobacterium succinicans]OAZ04971.1 bifunctional ligase/repressor BirA [Flavobacterium succinicans]
MKLIKLDAIDSTNDFLKGISSLPETVNFTVVTAELQTKGKGQMGHKWESEVGKNLIMSVLVKDFFQDVSRLFHLNIAFALAVIEALESYNVPELSIKWPNDIMSYSKKIGGILIENSIKSDGSIESIIGLGLNVNQTNFEDLPKASSLAVICGVEFDRELILRLLVKYLKQNIEEWQEKEQHFWKDYKLRLFKKDIPMPFADENGVHFMGIIQGVSAFGKLQVLLEDDSFKEFDIKEIQMLY